MSIKEHVNELKEELSQEEKFFEQAVKAERFLKRYKLQLITLVVVLLIFVVGKGTYGWMENQRITAANKAYLTLQSNPSDSAATQTLKEKSPALYAAYRYAQAVKSGDAKALEALSKEGLLALSDLARYELASQQSSSEALNSYSYEQNAIMKEWAILNEAALLMQKGSTAEAQGRLALIAEDSPLAQYARLLKHYGIAE